MTVTIEELEAAPVGSNLLDDDGDSWVKNANKTWDWILSDGEINGSYSNWSDYTVSSLTHDRAARLLPLVKKSDAGTISKKDLMEWLDGRYYHGAGAANLQRDLIEDFGLEVKQDLVITLRIPVTNMDPMGDTYQVGREKISGMNLYNVIDAIDTVEVTERKAR